MKRFRPGLFGIIVILCAGLMLTAFAKNGDAVYGGFYHEA
jgi:hypothetical protein